MEFEARRYARRIILVHLLLLLAISLVLVWAARVLYHSAREQAIEQAKITQELLTKQTALSIENYYDSVFGVVELLQPVADQATTDPTTLPDETTARRAPNARAPGAGNRLSNGLANAIWFSIRDKASMLALIDSREEMRIVRIIGTADDAPPAQSVINDAKDWLKTVHHRALSPLVRTGNAKIIAHLIAVPLRNSDGQMIVALVPISRLEKDVLENVNRSATTGVMLIDEAGTFLSATNRAAVGHNIRELNDPRTRALAEKHHTEKFAGTTVFDSEEHLGDVTFKRGMSTIQPFIVLGQTWSLIISSDLSEIENFIRPVFRNVALWAMCVALAIAALLASTAYRLIRSRGRLDRMQREAMTREITEARKIQLHWLPKGNYRADIVEVAAINRPATHVSGDFYNWFALEDGRFVVTIGDVTGHGMAAAFLMATTQLLVRNIMPRVNDPGECLAEVNRQLLQQSFNGQFVTLLIVVIDAQTGTMEVATAGHPAPLVQQDGTIEALKLEPQYVLGVEASANYQSQRFDLRSRESIVLYTDGAVDAVRPDGERFHTDRLMQTLRQKHADAKGAESIIATLDHAVTEFRQGRDLIDDLTLVAVQVHLR